MLESTPDVDEYPRQEEAAKYARDQRSGLNADPAEHHDADQGGPSGQARAQPSGRRSVTLAAAADTASIDGWMLRDSLSRGRDRDLASGLGSSWHHPSRFAMWRIKHRW